MEGLAGFWAGRRPEQCQRPRADSGLGSGTETLQFHKVQANCSEKSVIKKKKSFNCVDLSWFAERKLYKALLR